MLNNQSTILQINELTYPPQTTNPAIYGRDPEAMTHIGPLGLKAGDDRPGYKPHPKGRG
jgi:hypothetical protein